MIRASMGKADGAQRQTLPAICNLAILCDTARPRIRRMKAEG